MADYVSKYTGAQIDEAVGKALAGTTDGTASVTADSIKTALGYTPADKTVTDNLTTKVSNLETKLDNISGGTTASDVPAYVTEEAESVIDRVLAAQGPRTFTLAVLTDMHYGNGGYTDGIKHACQALKYIDERVKLDAVAILGDYTDGYPSTTLADAMADYRAVNALLDGLRFAPNLRQMGNHDYYPDSVPTTRRLVQFYSDDVVWGDRQGGYFYRDFDDYKLRIIALNCNENNIVDSSTNYPTSGTSITATQAQWFADLLADLNAKDDAAEWQVLVLSHQPLDYWSQTGIYTLARIAYAYDAGTTFSDSYATCDFSAGKNKASFVCNIHGHIHNLLVSNIRDGHANDTTAATSGVYRVGTPNACYGRENQYDGVWKESTTYSKTQNSAKDTSIVVYCIDLDNHIINAVCYGAGYDRTLVYAGDTMLYSVSTYMPNVASSNTATSVVSGASYTATLTANAGYTLGTVQVLMGGTDITATAYANGKITIAEVTGDINIIAEVVENGGDSGYTNIIDSVGYSDGQRLSTSSGTLKEEAGYVTTGLIDVTAEDFPVTIRTSGVNFLYSSYPYSSFAFYGADGSLVGAQLSNTTGNAYFSCSVDSNGNMTLGLNNSNYGRLKLCGYGSGANLIVTLNEEIS